MTTKETVEMIQRRGMDDDELETWARDWPDTISVEPSPWRYRALALIAEVRRLRSGA